MKGDDRHEGRPSSELPPPPIVPFLRNIQGRVVTIREANVNGDSHYVEALGEGLEVDITREIARLTERRAA